MATIDALKHDYILNKKLRVKLQKNSIKNFYLTNELAAKKIDLYRYKVFKT